VASGRRSRGQAHRGERDVETRLDALRQRRVREIHDREREARIDLGRPRERARRLGEVILAQHLTQVLEREHRALAEGQLRQPKAVPRVGPVGLEFGGPLEFARRVVIV